MLASTNELRKFFYKPARLAWRVSVGAFLVAAGCQSVDSLPPQFQTNARSVHLEPVGTAPIAPVVYASANNISETRIASVQAVEPLRAGDAVPSTQQATLGAIESGQTANGGSPSSSGNALHIELDLFAALQLAGVDNPTINLAREQIREALAQQLNARVLLLPNLNIGGNYHYNNGPVQTSTGQLLPVSDQALYMGFGAGAVGATSVAYPGLWLSAHLGDAVFEPLAARENVVAQRSNSVAVQNAIMGDVVTAYLRLVGSAARLDVLRRADVEGAEVVRLTAEFDKAGEGLPGDANRAKAFNTLVERARRAAEEDVDVASTQLCRLLNIDPSNHLRTPGDALEAFRLIPEDTDVEILIARAMQDRPELMTRSANIREAQVRVRQEKVRPFLPVISVGVSAGAFGGESNLVSGGFTSLASRTDIDAMAVWNLQNLGFGNRARVREATAVVGQSLAEFDSTRNLIRREVVEALAEARAAAQQLEFARAAAINSKEGFDLDLLRIKGGQGIGRRRARPIELLDSFNDILLARQDLVAALTRFDIAQFRLFVAVGSNPLNGPDVSKLVPTAVWNGPASTPQPMPIMPTPPKP
jgi:outer membrane protein TolC